MTMDKSSLVRQLEVVVENLKHDKDIMREEQMNFESTTEEVNIHSSICYFCKYIIYVMILSLNCV